MAVAAVLIGVGFALANLFADWVWVFCLPSAGLAVGSLVGVSQERVLELSEDDRAAWRGGSALGGIVGIVTVALVAVLLSFDVLVARLIAGATFATILGGFQIVALVGTDWVALRRWALVQAFAGGMCGWISLAGTTIWLPVTCVLGTCLFGIITGGAMIRAQQIEN